MAIHQIDDQGNLTWLCPHWSEEADKPCGTQYQHHISHEAIQWHGHPGMKPEHQTVSLPPCPACDAQTFLKVAFTAKELRAPNMWQVWNDWHQEQLQALQDQHDQAEENAPHKALLAGQIEQLQAAKEAGGYHLPSHAMAMRHVELAKQLVAMGKVPAEQGEFVR